MYRSFSGRFYLQPSVETLLNDIHSFSQHSKEMLDCSRLQANCGNHSLAHAYAVMAGSSARSAAHLAEQVERDFPVTYLCMTVAHSQQKTVAA
jgi:hypothetical protein